MEEKKGEMAKVNHPKTEMVQIPEEWGMGPMRVDLRTSIAADTPEGGSLIWRCLMESGESVDENVNKEVAITDYLISPATFNDSETGEIVTTIVTRLVCDDGRIISTHSKGILKCLLTAIAFIRPAPWNPPLRIVFERRQLKDKKSWTVFRVLTPLPPKKGK